MLAPAADAPAAAPFAVVAPATPPPLAAVAPATPLAPLPPLPALGGGAPPSVLPPLARGRAPPAPPASEGIAVETEPVRPNHDDVVAELQRKRDELLAKM